MEIDITKYIPPSEIADIIREELRDHIRTLSWRDCQTLVTNAAHMVIWDALSKELGDDAKQMVVDRAKELIGELDKYEVFHSKTEYTEEGVGRKYIDEAMGECGDAIKDKVSSIVDGLDADDLYDMVTESVYDAVREWLWERSDR